MTLSAQQIDALRAAVTRDETLALLLAAGAPIYVTAEGYRCRADVLLWLARALGLDDSTLFYEED